jgi:sugar lactone lactonase YvrE
MIAFISMNNVHIIHFTSEALGHRSHLHVAAVALGVIQTIAGNGTRGYSGDGGQASNAMLDNPEGVYVDQSGRIYIADKDNHAIRMIDTTGIITTVAGGNGTLDSYYKRYSGDGGQASSAQLNRPYGVYVDQSGRIYIGDTHNSAVRMIDTTGIISTVAGTSTVSGFSGDGGQASSAKLNSPNGVHVDQSGRIYIADSNNNAIRMVDTTGIITTVAGGNGYGNSGDGGQASSAKLGYPRGVYVDQSGRIYIADDRNYAIRMFQG